MYLHLIIAYYLLIHLYIVYINTNNDVNFEEGARL